jgi:hypothetical protein
MEYCLLFSVVKQKLPNPALTQTCFAAEDAVQFAKFGSGQSRVRSQNAGWLRNRSGLYGEVI